MLVLRLRLICGWGRCLVEMMLSRSLVDIELRLGLGKGSKTVLGYTHVVEQL